MLDAASLPERADPVRKWMNLPPSELGPFVVVGMGHLPSTNWGEQHDRPTSNTRQGL